MFTTTPVRRSRLGAAAAAAFTAVAALSFATPAHAEGDPTLAVDSNGGDTMQAPEKCAEHTDQFRFRFYYHSGNQGAWVNVGHPVYDLKYIDMGAPPLQPLKFCPGTGDGALQPIANNAASVFNWYQAYCGTVYYSAGYKGASETIFHGSGANLTSAKNNNRSINFTSCW
ncbi:hypothetical protein [Streptomyces sp. NPDC050485]|uniref:hypothetical protein n=1 Tax=Streptomyces sp. NPDC050485 TaxID=3365617 RepID=UPI0037935C8B